MKLGIMQPYFFPYLGYWQLLDAVDKYIVYDNIEFTKNSWIRRNRILLNHKDKMFTLPLKADSDYLDIRERFIVENFEKERTKILSQIMQAYKKAPYFDIVYPIIESCLKYEDRNLFNYIYNTILQVASYLDIKTDIIVSSTIDIDHTLKGKDKVLALCKKENADEYYNSIGGIVLYDKDEFYNNGIKLSFLKMNDDIVYKQFNNEFVANLSIIDVMMFNSKDSCKQMLKQYSLL